jgi:hypothetical protein
MTEAILKEYEERNKLFSDIIGYHHWHDPMVHRPYEPATKLETYYEIIRHKGPIKDFNIKNFEYIGEFSPADFQWFSRPR